jgi:hypothetical protein
VAAQNSGRKTALLTQLAYHAVRVSPTSPRSYALSATFALTLLACNRKPTYHDDVAPILAASCVSCHRTGGVAPTPLLETYEQAASAAGKIRLAVQMREMPPWGADNTGLCKTWRGALALADADIRILTKWTEAPAAGDPGRARPRTTPVPAPFRPSGVTLDPGADFAPGLGPTAYRCFVVDPGLSGDRLLTAIRVVSTEPRSVEQVTLYGLDSPEAELAASALDAGDSGPGYGCYGSSRAPGARLVASWTWDASVLRFPAGSGVALRGGHKLVLQVHYNPITTGLDVPTRPRVDLELGDGVREASFFPVAPNGFALAPARSHVEASARIDVPRRMTLLGVAPRMHSRGKTMELELLHAGGHECLGNFDHWNFYRQRLFEYTAPITLQAGDAVRVSCVYDTEGRQDPVQMGQGIEEEECLASLLVY